MATRTDVNHGPSREHPVGLAPRLGQHAWLTGASDAGSPIDDVLRERHSGVAMTSITSVSMTGDDVPIFVGVLLFFGGAAMAIVGRLSSTGSLKRNRLVGIRTTATLQDEASWKRGHTAGGSRLLVGGLITLVGGIVCPFLDPEGAAILATLVALTAAGLAMAGGRAASKALPPGGREVGRIPNHGRRPPRQDDSI